MHCFLFLPLSLLSLLSLLVSFPAFLCVFKLDALLNRIGVEEVWVRLELEDEVEHIVGLGKRRITIWMGLKLLYAGFHTPKAVTYHAL